MYRTYVMDQTQSHNTLSLPRVENYRTTIPHYGRKRACFDAHQCALCGYKPESIIPLNFFTSWASQEISRFGKLRPGLHTMIRRMELTGWLLAQTLWLEEVTCCETAFRAREQAGVPSSYSRVILDHHGVWPIIQKPK